MRKLDQNLLFITQFLIKRLRFKGEGASYQHIFQNLLRSADMNDNDLDISNVTGEVDGYLVAREGSIQAAMEPLLRLGDVDLVESGFKLILQTRSNKAPVEISEGDLLSPRQTSRLQEAELARSVSLTHYNTDTGFLPGIQQVKRVENPSSVVFGRNDVSYQVPIALSGIEAKQFVLQNLKAVWKERNVSQFQLPIKYLHLDPADRLHIADTDIRITQTHFLQDLSLEVETVGSRSLPSELGEVTADSGKGYVEVPVAQAKKTDLFLLDLPLLEDSHASGGEAAQHYYAVSNKSSTWTNSAVFVSENNTRFDLAQIFSNSATWGFAVNALPPPQYVWRTDKENCLDVEFLNGKERVEAVSELELLSGKNLLLVGEELVQFSDVEWMSSTRVRLKNLIRGRRGTEDMVTSHKVAEKVILLNSDTISKRRVSLSSLNMTKYFRAVSSGELLEDAKSIPQKFTGRDLKPYAPVISSITRTATTIEIHWHRRSRISSSGLSASPPLAERDERYELEFIYGGKQASVFVSAAQIFTYTLDQFNEQFGETLVQIPAIDLRIYQLSEAVGRGIAAIKENI